MTAPTRSRTRTRPERTQRPRQRAVPDALAPDAAPEQARPRRTQQRGRSTAAERAYARRAQRTEDLRVGEADAGRGRLRLLPSLRLRLPRSRASFVLLMMGLLAAGVATTLWLSTQAIADTYRLEELRGTNADLAERAEQLQREVTLRESPSWLADQAKQLGMVPGGDPARLVVAPDGTTKVVGDPKQATKPAPPPPSPADGGQSQEQQDDQAGGGPPPGDNASTAGGG